MRYPKIRPPAMSPLRRAPGDENPGSGETASVSREPLTDGGASWKEPAEVPWLDLDALAEVTIVVGGRRAERRRGSWSAKSPGEQLIDIRFHRPTSVGRLRVVSSEAEQSRTQEMTIWASLHRGEQHREILRQQFNFSPRGATEEVEDYGLQLEGVSAIQLRIVPSIDGRPAVANVREVRVAAI